MSSKTSIHVFIIIIVILLAGVILYLLYRGASIEQQPIVPSKPVHVEQRKPMADVMRKDDQERVVNKDVQRKRDIHTLLNALHRSKSEHGVFPDGILQGTKKEICRKDAASCEGFIDLSETIIGKYLASIPIDPDAPDGNGTRYFAEITEDGALVITAPDAHQGEMRAER